MGKTTNNKLQTTKSDGPNKFKVSIIGAGAVGSTLAMRVVESGVADVVIVDIVKDLARAKAIDISDAAPLVGHERTILGTTDYAQIRSSDVVVITAGLPRKPGMTREELINKNAAIIRNVSAAVKANAPRAIVIVVTNPLDTMTYLAYRTTGFGRRRVFGMAGVLDGSRFVNLISDELKVPRSSIRTYILGSHGDTMVPVLSHTRVSGKLIFDVLSKNDIARIVKRTSDRGAEIVSLLGTGSAYYSPSAAVFRMIKAILADEKADLTVSAFLEGEYGLNDICIGVPCTIGKKGIEKIWELNLSEEERVSLSKSAGAITDSIKLL